jgi:hypothetical protein
MLKAEIGDRTEDGGQRTEDGGQGREGKRGPGSNGLQTEAGKGKQNA